MGAHQTTNLAKKLERTEGCQSTSYIDSLPTFNKLCLAQSLLKEMYSLKERFEDNKNKMIGQLEQNCFKYYKNKLNSKEIYDYFESKDLEYRNNYKLINNTKAINKYKNIYDLLFLIRNNNSLIIELINKCEPNNYQELSYFLVHFFYEDTTNCSFFQEELLLLIYLFLENIIIKKLPMKLNSSILKKDSELYNSKIKNNFIFHFFYSLTKKTDIRNYLCSSISDIIIKMEESKDYLAIEPKILAKILGFENENAVKIENILKIKKEPFPKDSKTIKSAIKFSIIKVKKRISAKVILPFDGKNIENKNIEEKNEKTQNLEHISTDKIKIDPFFTNEDINYMYICEKLNQYENIKEKSQKDYAMIEYLDILLNEITKEGEPIEVFSTILLKNELKLYKLEESQENYERLVTRLKLNYDTITSILTTLLIKIKENINSLPFSLKCIFKIIDELLNKKYSNIKKGIFNYQLIISKARILFGCMIIPMLSNPDCSGIYTNGIISKKTKDNLDVIVEILKKFISGNLFSVDEVGYTLYNKFIINSVSNIFDTIIEIDNNITLPTFITELINSIPEKIETIENIQRNINYNYFKEKKEEKIQFQGIIFSWEDLYIILDIINKNTKNILNKCKNEEEKELLNQLMCNSKDDLKQYLENHKENIKKKVIDYYLITKIFYEENFEKSINSIIKDNFEILFQGEKNSETLRFKKCLSEVLAYVNYLRKEDFILFIKREEPQILIKNSLIKDYIQTKKKNLYENITFDTKKKNVQNVKNQNDLVLLRKNLKKITKDPLEQLKIEQFFLKRRSSIYTGFNEQENENEQLDFKNDIFPQIASKALSEIYYNPSKGKSERIIFCIYYMQEHIDNLPFKYSQNNYNQILLDILKEPEILIKELQNNILNQFHSKIRNSEKLNVISSNDSFQIKNMERYSYTGHLFNKIVIKGNLKKNINNGKIVSVELDINNDKNNNQNIQNNLNSIQSFINEIPNFREFEDEKVNIINLEKKLKINDIINNYFKEMNNIIKNEKMISRFSFDEYLLIKGELENYVLFKLYDKLYPLTDTQEDNFFYKKCCRLNFIKPENIIKNKKMINEKLLDISINYISEMDKKLTPVDKIKIFGKAIDILKNSMTFNSGKTDLGLDDTLPFIIYIILKSKQKNIYTNFNYCNLFINPELSKKQFGNMLTQLGMVMDIIKNMKYNELINVTEQQFGKDE